MKNLLNFMKMNWLKIENHEFDGNKWEGKGW
jgi:hypothetical protein